MNAAFVSGFLLSFSLILAIGPQNAFVLRQGLLRQHVFPIAVFCATSDIILILLGIFGFGSIISDFDGFSQYMFIIGGFWLSGYGILRLKGAYVADSFLEASNEEESDLNDWDNEDLMQVAWEQILKNPDKYRYGNSDYDNEEIMNYNLQRI